MYEVYHRKAHVQWRDFGALFVWLDTPSAWGFSYVMSLS